MTSSITSSITSFSYHNPTAIEFGWGALARLPELVKSVVGSFSGTIGAEGRIVCPRSLKKAR